MKYGPGKFEGNGNYALVAQYISANTDEELGDAESFGWYGRFSGKIKGRGPFHAIVNEDSQGFVDVTYCDTKNELDSKWNEIASAYELAQGPGEDDITTKDHCKFYQYGKLVLKIGIDDDHIEALRKYMKQEQFWPNAWFISDHGNAHIIEL